VLVPINIYLSISTNVADSPVGSDVLGSPRIIRLSIDNALNILINDIHDWTLIHTRMIVKVRMIGIGNNIALVSREK